MEILMLSDECIQLGMCFYQQIHRNKFEWVSEDY